MKVLLLLSLSIISLLFVPISVHSDTCSVDPCYVSVLDPYIGSGAFHLNDSGFFQFTLTSSLNMTNFYVQSWMDNNTVKTCETHSAQNITAGHFLYFNCSNVFYSRAGYWFMSLYVYNLTFTDYFEPISYTVTDSSLFTGGGRPMVRV